jgi:hypothetical protein
MYEVSPKTALIPNPMDAYEVTESQIIAIKDFHRYLIRKFGTIQVAWDKAFDTDGSGDINFTEFGIGCKAAGYVGNASRLWCVLDDDLSGEISLQELSQDADQLIEKKREAMKQHKQEMHEKQEQLKARHCAKQTLNKPAGW